MSRELTVVPGWRWSRCEFMENGVQCDREAVYAVLSSDGPSGGYCNFHAGIEICVAALAFSGTAGRLIAEGEDE